MRKLSSKIVLNAAITFGLNKGYSSEAWTLNALKDKLALAQNDLKNTHGILLSAKVTPCYIVFMGQDEASVTISFINYPKFPIDEETFKLGVSFIAETLMYTLEQHRIVIEWADETTMLEINNILDPKIELNK